MKISEVIDQVSPMMRHYLETKADYPDCILFYRLGDFYEMFFDDAETASKALELTLTGKACGLKERAPMCGVPYHAAETYITRLVAKGYKVAVCEQMEDPKDAKGIVKRDVIRIVTPGTNLNMQSLDESRNNYLMCVFYAPDRIGISVADVTTGDYYLTEAENLKAVTDEIVKYHPSELIFNEAFTISGIDLNALKERLNVTLYPLEARYFDEEAVKRLLLRHFRASSLTAVGIAEFPSGTLAAGALLQYLTDMQKSDLSNFTHLYPYLTSRYMLLDAATRRNLELTETLRDKMKRGTLLWVLDRTKTAMGARLLRSFIEQPLIDPEEIRRRQNAVACLSSHAVPREEIREYLRPVYDLERLMARISYQTVNPRDLLAFGSSLRMLPAIRIVLQDLTEDAELARLNEEIDDLTDIAQLIGQSIAEEAPLTIREGGIIREGFDEDVDRMRKAGTDGQKWLLELENETRERTGIRNLRIKFSNHFGYAFEVTNSFRDKVPEDFIRRQTLTTCERYTTPRLKELEDTILNAQERLKGREYEVFCSVRDKIAGEIARIQTTARAVALLDVYASLSYVAEANRYVKPEITTDGILQIRDGRHPVVEKLLDTAEGFIANDTYLDDNRHAVAVITGPNMAGKSTYMRQSALIVLMAQIGSFVPASAARIGIVDRIFTRVGASDDLGSGQSTFMVEMNEVANILQNATSKSLLILDEIGRGTSTWDGLSIAWAVIEHVANRKLLGARTLFATHYHELTELEGKLDNVSNYCIAVKERGDNIVFLRKIMKGGADKSYGIQVAKLAGVPDMVIERAKEIADELSDQDITERVQELSVRHGTEPRTSRNARPKHYDEVDLGQMSLFGVKSDADIVDELRRIDITTMTPMDALNTLYKLQNEVKNQYGSHS